MPADNSPPEQHRSSAPSVIRCAVLTVSDSRTLTTDQGGQTIVELLTEYGHQVVSREIAPDQPQRIRQLVLNWADQVEVDAILLTGGTGISSRDRTFETISELLERVLPGYGELFRWLSFQEIGPAAMLSRSIGGLVRQTVLLTMPGSPAAVRLAMQRLILPELGHLVQQAGKSG